MLFTCRLVGPLSSSLSSHTSTVIRSTAANGHHQTLLRSLAPSKHSFSSKADQPNNKEAGAKSSSKDYRNTTEPSERADLLGTPFAHRSINDRWQGLLHNRGNVNDSTLGFPSYSGPVVSLHSAMQSNVPKPYSAPNEKSSFPTHHNMPGGGVKGQQRFVYGGLHNTHPSKQRREANYPVKFAVPVSAKGEQEAATNYVSGVLEKTNQEWFDPATSSNLGNDVDSSDETGMNERHIWRNVAGSEEVDLSAGTSSPEGVQGKDCAYFDQWMENCVRLGLNNCDEQLHNLKTGRKTLQQVHEEQLKIIEKYALKKPNVPPMDTGKPAHTLCATKQSSVRGGDKVPASGGSQQLNNDHFQHHHNHRHLHNNQYYHHQHQQQQHQHQQQPHQHQHYQGYLNNPKVFEPLSCIRGQSVAVVLQPFGGGQPGDHHIQQRVLSTSAWLSSMKQGPSTTNDKSEPDPGAPPQSATVDPETLTQLTRRQQLQRAVKEYGSTVMVFHVSISLVSLGSFYLAVSSGIDLVGIMMKLGIGENILQSRLASGASTFVVAYAVHKVFAPVRIAITLSSTPLIVKYLRLKGILKPPKPKQTSSK
ncbi:hypothetical protein Ahia01_000484900 [Argonauta hians]